jgi:hypothetical protein
MKQSKHSINYIVNILEGIHLLKLNLSTIYNTKSNDKEKEDIIKDIERLDSIKIQVKNLEVYKADFKKEE